jgi:hypothetical protein
LEPTADARRVLIVQVPRAGGAGLDGWLLKENGPLVSVIPSKDISPSDVILQDDGSVSRRSRRLEALLAHL